MLVCCISVSIQVIQYPIHHTQNTSFLPKASLIHCISFLPLPVLFFSISKLEFMLFSAFLYFCIYLLFLSFSPYSLSVISFLFQFLVADEITLRWIITEIPWYCQVLWLTLADKILCDVCVDFLMNWWPTLGELYWNKSTYRLVFTHDTHFFCSYTGVLTQITNIITLFPSLESIPLWIIQI